MSEANPDDHNHSTHEVIPVAVISFLSLLWTIYILTRVSKRLTMLPHSQTLVLMVFQIVFVLGKIIHYSVEVNNLSMRGLKLPLYLIQSIGNYGARINTALIRISLYMITRFNYSNFVTKSKRYLQAIGITIPIVLSAIVIAIKHGAVYDHYKANDPNFGFKEEPIVVLTVLTICTLVTLMTVIIAQREHKKSKLQVDNKKQDDVSKRSNNTEGNSLAPIVESSIQVNEPRCQWRGNEMVCQLGLFSTYMHECQILRHTLLLAGLSISMILCKLNYFKFSTSQIF